MSPRQERGVPLWVALGIAFLAAVAIVVASVVLHFALRPPASQGVSAPAPSSSVRPSPSAAPTEAAPANTPTSAAAGFVSAFTDHAVPTDAWEKNYASYLTEQAKTAYAGTNRDRVPGTRVTGPAKVTAGASAAPVPGSADDDGEQDQVPAIVTVPTDAGTYTVNLQQQNGRWLVVSAQLPGSDE